MSHFKAFRWIALLLIIVGLSLIPQTQSLAEDACGSWMGKAPENDYRIEITPITESSGTDCHGAFRFSNNTRLWVFGGYTLDLTLPRSDNAGGAWAPYIAIPQENTFLTPSLDMELHVTPEDKPSEAFVSVQGETNPGTVAVDISLYLLKGAFSLIPAGTCIIPEEQVVFTAISVSGIVRIAAERALRWDFVGAGKEILQIKDQFFERASEILAEIGVDCGAEFIAKEILKKPAIVLELVFDYITWIPLWINDYFKYEGRPTEMEFAYSGAPAVTSTKVVVFQPSSTIDKEREGYCWFISIAVQRPGAWRCMVGDEIHDPCFSSSEDPETIICGTSPISSDHGFKLKLTQPLPEAVPAPQDRHPWLLELADGTTCREIAWTGTRPPLLPAIEQAIEQEGTSYQCSDDWYILGKPQEGQVWMADKVLLTNDGDSIENLIQVPVRVAWQ